VTEVRLLTALDLPDGIEDFGPDFAFDPRYHVLLNMGGKETWQVDKVHTGVAGPGAESNTLRHKGLIDSVNDLPANRKT
jgi:hypothetical protein